MVPSIRNICPWLQKRLKILYTKEKKTKLVYKYKGCFWLFLAVLIIFQMEESFLVLLRKIAGLDYNNEHVNSSPESGLDRHPGEQRTWVILQFMSSPRLNTGLGTEKSDLSKLKFLRTTEILIKKKKLEGGAGLKSKQVNLWLFLFHIYAPICHSLRLQSTHFNHEKHIHHKLAWNKSLPMEKAT